MSKIIDAVSVVLTYGHEIFIIQRQNYLKAFPGYWAFPGGKVEAEDSIFSLEHPLTSAFDQSHVGAVLRETSEELGVDLMVEIHKGIVTKVDYLGLATTPDFNPLRFATHFFRFHLKDKIPFVVDRNEVQHAQWISSSELLRRYNYGEILAVPPVIKVIQTLGDNFNVTSIPDLNFHYDAEKNVPYIESIKSVRQLMPLSHTLPPANRTNAFLIGDQGPKTIIDPSPKDQKEYERFKNTLSVFGADQIFLTHHHPDHHERSTDLARELKLPMLMSEDTRIRLNKIDPNYFEGIKTHLVKEGDYITHWLGRSVYVHEVPGHDEGQLALAPEDLSWFIAGDLFQGVGTVVIGGDEGDMSKYINTLEKVIRLNPKVIFPSHGIGLGGVDLLERTLEHRRLREHQVYQYFQDGLNEQEMLEKIYSAVDKKLWPYAIQNIRKHLEKLRRDGRI